MGDVLDLGLARAKRAADDHVAVDGALLTWDAGRRIVHLSHDDGRELDADDATSFVAAILRWVGDPPTEAYAVLVRGPEHGDALGTVAYRKVMGARARQHRAHCRQAFYGGSARSRFLATTYLRGIGVQGGVLPDAAAARAWLCENGFA